MSVNNLISCNQFISFFQELKFQASKPQVPTVDTNRKNRASDVVRYSLPFLFFSLQIFNSSGKWNGNDLMGRVFR